MLDAQPVPETAPLFAPLGRALVALLRSLAPADWDQPTIAGRWRVRDVAAHLLDGDFRKLSGARDGHRLAADRPITDYADVLSLINTLNAAGVEYAGRLSPRVLTDLLDVTARWVSDFVSTLDPEAPAAVGVAWAGETCSTNRFDIAREYTERWHHQMQIRDALGSAGHGEVLLAPTLAIPLFETSIRALPHAYRAAPAPDHTAVTLSVPELDRSWTLRRTANEWRLETGADAAARARIVASADTLWRLFYNALPEPRAAAGLSVSGSDELLAPFFGTRSVMV